MLQPRYPMKLSLEGLQILDAISRRGSFAAAAEELFRVPSTITYAVQKLEEDLGVPIFQRNGHRPRLTPAGEALLKEGQLILQAAAELEERVRRVSAGYEARLTIAVDGMLPCAPLLELARDFYSDEQHAETDLRIAHQTGPALDALVADKAEMACGVLGDGTLRDGKHRTRLIGVLELILAVSPDHPLAGHRGPVPPQVLLMHRVALMADIPGRAARRPAGQMVGQKNITLPTLHAKIAAQKAGFAAGFVPRAVVQRELQAGELVEVPLDRPAPRENVYLAWNECVKGKAFEWWLQRLDRPTLVDEWLNRTPLPLRRQAVSQLVVRRV